MGENGLRLDDVTVKAMCQTSGEEFSTTLLFKVESSHTLYAGASSNNGRDWLEIKLAFSSERWRE